MSILLEICCGDIESVGAAISGGAGRIELCGALEAGGITPSAGLIEQALWKTRLQENILPVNVLVRPRSGDFLYTDRELRQCAQDTASAVGAGADGIVFGALTSDGDIDEYACAMILETIYKVSESGRKVTTTFHRAFDLCRDPFDALEKIISLGFDRILTSGQAASAEEGKELLKNLHARADGRIIIMPRAGVTSQNILGIIKDTGVSEIHASAKQRVSSRMRFRREGIGMGTGDEDEYSRYTTSSSIVKELSDIIATI